MRFSSVLLPLVATAMVFGCDDPASAPVVAPDLRAAQGDRSEWTLVLDMGTTPESDALPVGFVSCLNDGLGEDAVVFGGPYEVYMKTLVAPSGNVISHGWIRAAYEAYRGLESGDLWITSLDAKYREFTRQADGHLLLQEPITQVLTNERTGQRARVQAMYRLEFDESFNLVSSNPRNGEIFACHAWK